MRFASLIVALATFSAVLAAPAPVEEKRVSQDWKREPEAAPLVNSNRDWKRDASPEPVPVPLGSINRDW